MSDNEHIREGREPEDTPYGYIPTKWVCILFIVLFSITGVLHLIQAIRSKRWWLIPTMFVCALTEVIGWGGRLWSSISPFLLDPFLMQITTTIMAPSFMTAAFFIILGIIVAALGPKYSRLSPKVYSYVFLSLDLAALIVQAIGGASASQAAETGGDAEKGAKIMVGGILVQIVAVTLYVIVAAEFLWRYIKDVPINALRAEKYPLRGELTSKMKMMLLGMVIATVFVYIRSIYRTIELFDGWTGPIITNETLFNVLDGMPIAVAMFTLNVFHPLHFLEVYGMQTTPATPAEPTTDAATIVDEKRDSSDNKMV